MNIGVFGGTFDPVHNGHIMVAEEARARLNLAQVLFVPAGEPWLKGDNPISAALHRLRMVSLAIAALPYFKMSALEIERVGPSYTVDTITELRVQFGVGDELFFILGWDGLAELPRWREPARLITLCQLVAVPRPGFACPDLARLEAAIPGLSRRLTMLDKPEVDIGATDIRNRVVQGLAIDHLVPEPVDKYIKKHKLYLP